MGHTISWLERNADSIINVFQSDQTSDLISGSWLEFLTKSSFYAMALTLVRALMLNKLLMPFYLIISFLFFLSLIFITDVYFNLFASLVKKHSIFGFLISAFSLIAFVYLLA